MNIVKDTVGNQCILIVDDHEEVLKFMEIGFKHHGFEVIKATSGMEALELIRSREPDIMLLDIIMPEMDGLEVLRQLRSFSSMPVIAFSATPDNHDNAIKFGANEFMIKPFYPEDMISRVKFLLNQ